MSDFLKLLTLAGLYSARPGLELCQKFFRFRLAVLWYLDPDPFQQKRIDVLHQRSDLSQNKERNTGVLQQSLRKSKTDAVIGLEHHHQVRIKIGHKHYLPAFQAFPHHQPCPQQPGDGVYVQ
jgi:hypothetical protein